MHLDQKVSLKTLHTFGMEVEAKYFVEAKTLAEVLTLLNYRHMIHMPILFLGGGSNVLFTRDFSGIVIRISSRGIAVLEEDDHSVRVTAEAGEGWDAFVQYCVGRGWAGIENLSLIPGTVGAAPIQNIGAYGAEVKDVIESVRVVEIESGKQRVFSNADCCFGYRDSIFKQALKGKVIILNVTFKLAKTSPAGPGGGPEPSLRLDYGDIRGELARNGIGNPTIGDVRDVVCSIRRRKLPDPAEAGNAGSFFKNPVVQDGLLASLRERFPAMPTYLFGSDLVKVPAAWLIEQCGWKGYRSGDAGVHPVQPLVLVNYGNADGRQILALAKLITDSVRQKFGISLETEVNVID
ncbi:MAG: UDP-N-acetylmuramate dehydrogenase [Bacteroidota bacterium]